MNEDDHIYWQDNLESVLAGRTSDLKCPFCYEGRVEVTKQERKTLLKCQRCGHFIEGRFGNDEDMQ